MFSSLQKLEFMACLQLITLNSLKGMIVFIDFSRLELLYIIEYTHFSIANIYATERNARY